MKKLTDGQRTPSDGKYLRWPFGPGELKNEEKRAITPRWVIRFTSGHVDLDKLNMFAV